MPIDYNFGSYQYRVVKNTLTKNFYDLPFGVLETVTQNTCCVIGLFDSNAALRILDTVPKELIEESKINDLQIVITYALEPLVGIEDIIYDKLIIESNIPENKIILLTSNFESQSIIENLARKHNKNKIKTYYFSTFELQIQKYTKIESKNNGIKNKKYICLNRRWRLHRPFLVALLNYYNLLNDGYISLGRCDDNLNWKHSIPQLLLQHQTYICEETFSIISQNEENIKKIPDLYVDTDNLKINLPKIDPSIRYFFESSYFSVVTETLFFSEISFLTEKIFKPVAMKHPFILVGTPNLLTMFKKLGYRTFHPYINEDYDRETNHCKRMKLIIDEIKRLCELSESEWQDLTQKLQPIINYNFFLLKSRIDIKNFIYPLT